MIDRAVFAFVALGAVNEPIFDETGRLISRTIHGGPRLCESSAAKFLLSLLKRSELTQSEQTSDIKTRKVIISVLFNP